MEDKKLTLEEIAEKLKDRDLFPEKVARAKELLSNVKFLDPKKNLISDKHHNW